MAANTDARAIVPTVNAVSTAAKAGANVTALMGHLQLKLSEVQVLVKQIITLAPSGDANLVALNALLTELM